MYYFCKIKSSIIRLKLPTSFPSIRDQDISRVIYLNYYIFKIIGEHLDISSKNLFLINNTLKASDSASGKVCMCVILGNLFFLFSMKRRTRYRRISNLWNTSIISRGSIEREEKMRSFPFSSIPRDVKCNWSDVNRTVSRHDRFRRNFSTIGILTRTLVRIEWDLFDSFQWRHTRRFMIERWST